MSTAYDIYCRTCGVAVGFWDVYNRPEHLLELWNNREVFASAAGVEKHLETPIQTKEFISLPPGFFAWCSEHKDHDVMVKDEYGRFWDRCPKTIRCSQCGTYHDCSLERDHDGPCNY